MEALPLWYMYAAQYIIVGNASGSYKGVSADSQRGNDHIIEKHVFQAALDDSILWPYWCPYHGWFYKIWSMYSISRRIHYNASFLYGACHLQSMRWLGWFERLMPTSGITWSAVAMWRLHRRQLCHSTRHLLSLESIIRIQKQWLGIIHVALLEKRYQSESCQWMHNVFCIDVNIRKLSYFPKYAGTEAIAIRTSALTLLVCSLSPWLLLFLPNTDFLMTVVPIPTQGAPMTTRS